MSDYPQLKLFYLTDPTRGDAVVNIQEDGKELQRFQLSRDQLFALNAKTAEILLKGHK
jgi:hypothetical protein